MHAGLLKLGQWVLGAGLASFLVLAHAQPAFSGRGHGGGGFARAPEMHSMPTWGGANGARYDGGAGGMRGAVFSPRSPREYNRPSARAPATPVRVADQGGHRERGGRAPSTWQGPVEGAPVARHYGGASYGGFGGDAYRDERGSAGNRAERDGNPRGSPITQVSAETRQVPHPPADSPVRAGSIREDVARYNEERAAFRPLQRGGGDVPRPPMPSPYRN